MMTFAIQPEDTLRVYGPPQGQWTAEDWEQLPDDGNRYEIMDGVLYMTMSPSGFHQWILGNFWDLIAAPAKRQGLAFPYFAPMGVFMPGATPVQPDFFLVLAEHADIIHDRRVFGVPDLIIEVLSPGNSEYDLEDKYLAYARAGVPEYGIIDPSARTLTLHRLVELGHYEQVGVYGETDTVTFACLPTIPLHIGSLFAGAPDTTV